MFRQPGPPIYAIAIQLPPFPLEHSLDWVSLVQDCNRPWRLDLKTGQLTKVSISIDPMPSGLQVASDGQTIVFVDTGDGREIPPGSKRVRNNPPMARVVAWHPDCGLRTLIQFPMGSPWIQALPRGRVLVASDVSDAETEFHIVFVDGSSSRQIFP